MARSKDIRLAPRFFEASRLASLFDALDDRGYEIIGPTVRDGAVVLDQIHSPSELPAGWIDEQSPGHYRLNQGAEQCFFAHAVGPHSWKKFLHPAEIRLWEAEWQNGTFRILNNRGSKRTQFAFLGVRACDLAAIAVQDRVLMGDKYRDPIYSNRRDGTFIVAVHCTHSVETCFCASVGTGPRGIDNFDLALTEILNTQGHYFIATARSKRGAEVLSEIESIPATEEHLRQETDDIDAAANRQVRNIDTHDLKELLSKNFDNSRWEQMSARCLTCANCTMVCPTCFCTTVEDASDLSGNRAERWRRWDSCFTLSFSYIHGGSVRLSAKSRYRQWMTHKLASWVDQFGMLGCVGCGRCITWCPVGIDLTEQVRILREGETNGNP